MTEPKTPEPITPSARKLLAAYKRATTSEAKYRQASEDAAFKRAEALRALKDIENWSLARIAREAGVTRQRVQQLVAK